VQLWAVVTNFEKYFLHMMNVEQHLSATLPHTSKWTTFHFLWYAGSWQTLLRAYKKPLCLCGT